MDLENSLVQLQNAVASEQISEAAAENIQIWLTEPRYRQYAQEIVRHIAEGMWQQLDDVFWTVIPFGTGGRRGRMYPIGSNAINDATIGESAQGLADYVMQQLPGADMPGCAIAYDTRHRSREFAELCAQVMAAAGFRVFFLDGYRSTPELSFAVRAKNCACGIMVTASHNPPSDNAVKVYWSSGGQLLPPHDTGVIDAVMNVQEIQRTGFQEALAAGKIVYCQEEVDRDFIQAVAGQSFPGPRDLKIVYSPLHGVGASAICPALKADGFTDVETFAPHAQPDGDFPNVPGHVSNPENPEVFSAIIERAQEIGADLVMASDPDCDRIGCATPLTSQAGAEWATMTGNQIAALLTEYVLERHKAAGTLTPEHYIVKTLVTTDMMRRIADSYGVQTFGDLQVGFKWIGGVMDDEGPDRFLFGGEESHGYLVGQYARDKDAAVAAMLLAELAAQMKADGQTLHEKLDALFWQYGCHVEKLVSVQLPGAEGMEKTRELMKRFRQSPPETLGGLKVAAIRDYQNQTTTPVGGEPHPLAGSRGDMVMLDTESEGCFVAVRPSGTEPKVKFYMFAYEPAEQLANLETTKDELADRLDQMSAQLREFAGV